MGRLRQQMLELRELRDSAKGLLRADVAFLKGEAGGKPLAPRLIDNAGKKARDVAGRSAKFANEQKFKIGTGVVVALAALAGWIFRDRIEQAFDRLLNFFDDDGGTDHAEQALNSDEDTSVPTE